ncbi:tail fiber domain-containing protein [Trabulsiella odontotermitis]|uniref:tail fiber domain-containing protein n=1 Tax=Trabulsiella odontotermitis TaxID=379893 RepID=UPI0024B83B53|nr:tail fiber domain-containing protein [Trabulsiella odontotermitis]WHP32849.1 tail fiber domain-containing protein [Trabulsiella odontotermitis]
MDMCGFYLGTTNSPIFNYNAAGVKIRLTSAIQSAFAGRNNRFFAQTHESGAAQGWREITTTAVSDITLKLDVNYTDGSESWANIEAMKPVTFKYKNDETGHLRRGFVAQDLEKIDAQYIKRVNGAVNEDGSLREILTLDTNPLLMDALTVITLLMEKDKIRDKQLSDLNEAIKLLS